MNLYLDENWENALYQDTCEKKSDESKRTKILQIPTNGTEWSHNITATMSQTIRPHVWYFTADD